MAYTDFTLDDLTATFGIVNRKTSLFGAISPVEPSPWLNQTLRYGQRLSLRTEKARSELLVSPILVELIERNSGFLTLYSGERLNADAQVGLVGECDFLLARETGSYSINFPIFAIVEAKKKDIDLGIDQCAAQLLGARVYNEARHHPVPYLYGCSTTGEDWVFLKLENDIIYVDSTRYELSDLPTLLGVLQTIVDAYKIL